MSIRMGLDGKVYFCAAGIGGTPVWTEISNVKNVTTGLTKSEADVSTRGSGGWKAIKGALKDADIEFEMPWDSAADGFDELKASFMDGTLLGIAVMDGDIATAGREGLWADMEVVDFSRDEPLEEAMNVKVKLKPTYSANKPQWHVVASGAGSLTAEFDLALVDGAGTIDLTDMTDRLGGAVDLTGLKVQSIQLTNLGANTMTVGVGATNGFVGMGANLEVPVYAGAPLRLLGGSATTAVGAGSCTLDVVGTGTQVLRCKIVGA